MMNTPITLAAIFLLLGCNIFETAAFSSRGLPTRSTVTTSGLQQERFQQNANIIKLQGMKRPILDQMARTLFELEDKRVQASSVEDDQGRMGEPMEWSESNSLANRFSQLVQDNELGYQFKQFVADIVAGQDYDHEETLKVIDDFVASTTSTEPSSTTDKQPLSMFGNFFSGRPDESGAAATPSVAMCSFTTCPFCRRAKDYLDDQGIPYVAMELDELPGNQGNEIRASLGRKTRRTSVPSIFVRGQYIGGCNDGPGLLPLGESGELQKILEGTTA